MGLLVGVDRRIRGKGKSYQTISFVLEISDQKEGLLDKMNNDGLSPISCLYLLFVQSNSFVSNTIYYYRLIKCSIHLGLMQGSSDGSFQL